MSIAAANAALTAPGELFEMEWIEVNGVRLRSWRNAPPTLRDVFSAGRGHGDATFLVYENERVSFAGFARATLTLAHALVRDGVQKGDRVAVIMRNLPEWPVAFFAASLAGAIVTPLNAWWSGAELAYGLGDSGAKIAISDGERLARLAPRLEECPALEKIYVTRPSEGHEPGRAQALRSVIGPTEGWGGLPDSDCPSVSIAPDDPATIFYTSGTTSAPKGAVGSHRNMTANLMALGFSASRSALRRGGPPLAPPENQAQKVVLVSIPLFHVSASHALLSPALHGGARLVLTRKWDAEEALRLIQREGVTAAGGVPTIAWQLIEHPARPDYDLRTLESLSYGGAPAPPELLRRIGQSFPGAAPGTGWGMTETSATFTHHMAEDYLHRPESCGPALPVGDLRIMAPDGSCELPIGKVGELWVRGPNVVHGYWDKPEATQMAFVGGWLRTGDLARLDSEGFCYIVDRAKDMLIRGGENIYCTEIESVLYEHPAVIDAAVIGLAHRTLGEEPAAIVHLGRGHVVDEPELQAFVRERLAAFKTPVRVLFWPDMLPRNANGKILKKDLLAAFDA